MPDTVLQTIGLTKHFGSLTAVKDLTLDVFGGEIFGFLGPNGAGKTTTLNMMCGLLKPDAGNVLVHGVPISAGDVKIRRRIGVCPQEIVLWDGLTCLEQLEFIGEMYGVPRREGRRRGQKLLDALGLLEKRSSLARTLSGGMKRRLNLAMALVHDPEIIVLDEPEAGLDPQSRVTIREYLRSLAQSDPAEHQRTIILTSHNMDEVERVADRVAIIDHGELLVQDTPQELKQRLGSGDVIDIQLLGGLGDESLATRVLQDIAQDVSLDSQSGRLQVRALQAVGLLPHIIETLLAAGFQPGEVSIRPNSLEDVFIHLTGRKLRE